MITITLFVAVLLLIVSMNLFLMIKNVKNRLFLWVFIPLMLVMTGSTYFMVTDLMSQPVPYSSIRSEFKYLSHIVVDDKIYVWVMVAGQSRPWTVVMPRNPKTEENLRKAQQSNKAGHPMMGRPGKPHGDRDGTPGMESPFEFYDFAAKFYDLKNADEH